MNGCADDDLDGVLTGPDDSANPRGAESFLVYEVCVLYFETEAGDAAVDGEEVFRAAETF